MICKECYSENSRVTPLLEADTLKNNKTLFDNPKICKLIFTLSKKIYNFAKYFLKRMWRNW